MSMQLPMADDPLRAGVPPIDADAQRALSEEIRALAKAKNAVILAHNYQLPEVQGVADIVGDSLQLSIEAAKTDAETIVFCGVHFMAESASVLSPDKTVLIPDVDAGCSLADSITADQLRGWQAKHPGAITVMYVNTTADVKALTDYCVTSSNAVPVLERIYRDHGPDTEVLFGPDMFLGSYVAKRIEQERRERGEDVEGFASRFHVWDGECHVHAGIRPSDIEKVRAEHPGADFLIHPECGCSTQAMEYVAAGDIDSSGVHMLSTGGMMDFAEDEANKGPMPDGSRRTAIVATETGMLHPLRAAAPEIDFIPANVNAACGYMKMITLEKVRNCLRDGTGVVKVPERVAKRAQLPIERMIQVGRDANAPLGGE